MIDYSKYNLAEMQAIVTVLDDLTDEMISNELEAQHDELADWHVALTEFIRARRRAGDLIAQQAREAAEIDANNYKVAKVRPSSLYGFCVADPPAVQAPAIKCSNIDKAAHESPDMFGWVGDAIDDLCAAGEVL